MNEQAEVVRGQAVSGDYFTGLGVQPALGRAISNADDNEAAPPVVVLSHQYWQERFAANPDVIGKQLKLNQTPFTIIGVTPPAFTGTLQVSYRPPSRFHWRSSQRCSANAAEWPGQASRASGG